MVSGPSGRHLKLVASEPQCEQQEQYLYVGRRYSLCENLALDQARRVCADAELLVGAYVVTPERAQVLAADPHRHPDRLFVWQNPADSLALCDVLKEPAAGRPGRRFRIGNRLQVRASGLQGPVLEPDGADAWLRMTAAFDLDWRSDSCAAHLGAVELVESSRRIRFTDGTEHSLLDTAECAGQVRYAPAGEDGSACRIISPYQQRGVSSRHEYRVDLAQYIPASIGSRVVADVTVLEKYTSHIMQCEQPGDAENHIWVPLLEPLAWGWSIRVGRRTDGEWGILRRKLFMPTHLDEGLLLPEWQCNTRQLWHMPY